MGAVGAAGAARIGQSAQGLEAKWRTPGRLPGVLVGVILDDVEQM